ncbi:uncharacterized protein LOC131018960 [Salvia miltiorrhiza]|uniref:uncharacterized protein LOC131018960 n=1 Tax=Salvia miltiorrhiza TaxID=226208 RepID=UPI0025AD086D|nr:uncharacterized protein LOC131018960 [Salvia miltiorrhiza]
MAEKPSSGWVNMRRRKPSANPRSAPPPSSCSPSSVDFRHPSANPRSAPPPSSCSPSSVDFRQPSANPRSAPPPSSCSPSSVDFRQPSANPRSAPPPSCSPSSVDFRQPSANPRSAPTPSSSEASSLALVPSHPPTVVMCLSCGGRGGYRPENARSAADAELEMARKSLVEARDALMATIPNSAAYAELEKEKQALDKECDEWIASMAEWKKEFMVNDEDASETQSPTQNAWRCGEIFLIFVLLLVDGNGCWCLSVDLWYCC